MACGKQVDRLAAENASFLRCGKRQALLTVALISVIAHMLLFMLLPPSMRSNQSADFTRFYSPVAENILAGRGVVIADGSLAVQHPPGYSLLLAGLWSASDVCGMDRLAAVRVINVMLAACACVVLFQLAECIFGRSAACLAVLAWATYPPGLWLSKQPSTEVPYILLLLLATWLLITAFDSDRPGRLIGVGVILGSASLLRSAGLLLMIVFAGCVLFGWRLPFSRRWRLSALLAVGFILTVLLWPAYGVLKTGSCRGLGGSNARNSMLDGMTFTLKTGNGGDRARVPDDVRALMEDIAARKDTLPTVGAVAVCMLDETCRRPAAVGKLLLIKAGRIWYGTDEMWHERCLLALQTLYLLPACFGLWVGLRRGAPARRQRVLLAAIVFASMVVAMSVLSILRYMVPTMAFVLCFSGLGVARLFQTRAVPALSGNVENA